MNHVYASAGCLGFPFESCQTMADITVRLLDNKGQIFTKKVSIFGQTSKKSLPCVGHKSARMRVNFLNKFS